jgi:hypothetical protein
MYAGENQLDFAIRSLLRQPLARAPLSRDALEHFRKLPATTLFALATVVDFDPRLAARVPGDSSGALQRYLALLAGFRDPAVMGDDTFPRIGPQLILVWGQDLSERGAAPQVAIMAQCDDAQAMHLEMNHLVGNLLKVANAIGGSDVELSMERRTRLGVRIVSVPMAAFAARTTAPWAGLLAGTELSWAAWRNWFVCALTRDHLERIVEAFNGLHPQLEELPEVQSLQPTSSHRSSVAILRGDLAADVLDGWLRAHEADSPSLLDPTWWERPGNQSVSARRYFGIRMSPGEMKGTVLVTGVDVGAAASGLVEKGDTVLGIDGQLLDFGGARADLRRHLASAEPGGVLNLRLLRKDQAMEVPLRTKHTDASAGSRIIEPTQALRELASLGRSLELATFTALVPEGKRYSARLSLRFTPLPEE